MPFYQKRGSFPHKRHCQFNKPDGSLYREEVMGLEGFSGLQSLLYHHWMPTSISQYEVITHTKPNYLDFGPLRGRQFRTNNFPKGGNCIESKTVLLGNLDVELSMSRPTQSMNTFYRNGQAYEVWFCHQGSGNLASQFGNLHFQSGDYIVIPFGTIWSMELKTDEALFFVIESPTPIVTPKRYRNRFGQLLEHSPFCERDIHPPQELITIDKKGDFEVWVKVRDTLNRHMMTHHPFDVVGWDGYLFPYTFSIHDFEPITGRVHQPPPVHQTFEAHNFVICSFVPRIYDYHPKSIPAPYVHSNVNSDEVLYYVDGDFMSRKGVELGDWTLHPTGLPHGPQPGATEASIGKERTEELAVMVDTFKPLEVTQAAVDYEIIDYGLSWQE